MAIFNCYVNLPDGIWFCSSSCLQFHPWNLIHMGGDQTVEKAVVLSDADHPAMVLLRTESGYTTNAAIQDAAASYIYI